MKANAVISQMIGFLLDLGWGVTIGSVVLLAGGSIAYFNHWGETKKEKSERRDRDAARANERS
jgi:hypothetical protein